MSSTDFVGTEFERAVCPSLLDKGLDMFGEIDNGSRTGRKFFNRCQYIFTDSGFVQIKTVDQAEDIGFFGLQQRMKPVNQLNVAVFTKTAEGVGIFQSFIQGGIQLAK